MDRINYLKNLIHEKFKTQREFCSIAQIKPSTLSTIFERGIDKTTFGTIVKLCFTLEISIDTLVNKNLDVFYLNNVEKEIIVKLRNLSAIDIERIIGMIELKLSEQKSSYEPSFFKSQKR